MNLPETVLSVVVRELDPSVALLGVCAGYEDGTWRYNHLTDDLIEWVADWILTPDEIASLGVGNAVRLIGKALHRVYETTNYANRGEIGELLLHMILRKFLASERLISRIYFKDAANDTVKGYDAVHIVPAERDGSPVAELWLGESKFYANASSAIAAVLAELKTHLATPYLRTEFAAVVDKIPPGSAYEVEVRNLLARRVSLDAIFDRVVIPVFITYDSQTLLRHQVSDSQYLAEVEEEIREAWMEYKHKLSLVTLPREVRFDFICLPMNTKKNLIDAFDGRLKAWQSTITV